LVSKSEVVNFQNVTVNCTMVPYQFEPIAMVGGMLWTIGNVTVVPIIGLIGLGLGNWIVALSSLFWSEHLEGMLLWGLSNMIVGWMVGVFGLFSWIGPQTVATPALNYAGLALASFVVAALTI
jgi:hypothetical protein